MTAPSKSLEEQLANVGSTRSDAYDSWLAAAQQLRDATARLIDLVALGPTRPEVEFEQRRIEATIRALEIVERNSRRLLDDSDADWRELLAQSRWERDREVQVSTARATWAATAVALAVALPTLIVVAKDLFKHLTR